MWAHFIYLLLLPTLAVVAAFMMFPETEAWTQLLIVGFPSVLMYSLFLASGYAMPDSLAAALLQVVVIPLQIAFGVMVFGSGSIWLFFAENAAVEIGSFVLGVLSVALANRKKDSPGASFAFIILLVVTCFFGSVLPHIVLVFYAYGGPSLWLILFITAFITGYIEHSTAYRKLSEVSKKTRGPQNLDMIYDGGLLARLLRIDTKVKLLSPLWKTDDKTQINPRVQIFGFASLALPIITAIVIGTVFLP